MELLEFFQGPRRLLQNKDLKFFDWLFTPPTNTPQTCGPQPYCYGLQEMWHLVPFKCPGWIYM